MDPLSLVTAIGLTFSSYHFDRSRDRNESNPGIVVEVDKTWLAGVYRNSNGRTTVFAAGTLEPYSTPSFGLGLMLGVGTGYDQALLGALRVRTNYADVLVVPPLGPQGGVISATLKWSFK